MTRDDMNGLHTSATFTQEHFASCIFLPSQYRHLFRPSGISSAFVLLHIVLHIIMYTYEDMRMDHT